ncbi:MAG: transcriptional regulator, partial [Actinobacteria bacterium]
MVNARTGPIDYCHDKRKVKKALTKKLELQELEHLSDVFKALGDSARSQILHLLSLDELCVHDISELTSLSQSATSHHFRVLRSLSL